MEINEQLLISRILELFDVDVGAGKFVRRMRQGGSKPGETAGTQRSDGYRSIAIDRKTYLEHKLILLVALGFYPEYVDHINGNRADNRAENLRVVTPHINSRNQKMSAANKSGATGVRYRASRKAYEAYWVGQSGKKEFKYFPCARFESESEAMREASRYRKAMIEQLNAGGDSYTDRHGERIAE